MCKSVLSDIFGAGPFTGWSPCLIDAQPTMSELIKVVISMVHYSTSTVINDDNIVILCVGGL